MGIIKFRASSFHKLMTEPRSKSESLSETTKSYLSELFIENEYDRQKEYYLKYADKGNVCEPEGIRLLGKIDGVDYQKNLDHFSNDFIHGTPDIIAPKLIDIKVSWDIFTFHSAELKKEYYWQLQCYMWLTRFKESQLVYVLVDTPDYIIVSEQRRQLNQLLYKDGVKDFDQTEFNNNITKNLTYDDIEESKKIKRFIVPFEPELIPKMTEKVKLAREYYETISL